MSNTELNTRPVKDCDPMPANSQDLTAVQTRIRTSASAPSTVPSRQRQQEAADHIKAAARWAAELLASGRHADVVLQPTDADNVRLIVTPPSWRWDQHGREEHLGAPATPTAALMVACISYGGVAMWDGQMLTPEDAARIFTKLDARSGFALGAGRIIAEFLNRLATYAQAVIEP